ncbi:MAG: GspE/PulE family protein, partial [Planctomycetota bacterium]|nr:GspE/PulE family protein [Planctomycetota bacterium]
LADPALLELIGKDEALRLKVLPMFKVRGALTVAMAEPQHLPNIDRLGQITGCSIRPVLAMEANIVEFINRHAGMKADMETVLASLSKQEALKAPEPDDGEETPVVNLDQADESNPLIGLVNMVFLKAIRERVSDIHIEPDEKGTRIRYRLDGMLREVPSPPTGMHALIISRVKVLARMDIAEKRLPQEGRVRLIAEGRHIDLRVSSMPTLTGEKLVIRILDRANLTVRMEDMGFRSETLEVFKKILSQPCGMLLVTGPTGSGKTTTLYSALEVIRTPERNIVPVEDPVACQLRIINQIQVHEAIGMTFARALRSILRQDPDVIMVGEIRDHETARVAVQAALTGHFVLATLHTNDAVGAIARLLDMGIEPYLLSTALRGVLAQRLARTVCPHCIERYHPPVTALRDAALGEDFDGVFSHGTGCERCHGTGYRGRVGVYEFLNVTNKISRMIHEGTSPHIIRDRWLADGGLTLRQEGVLLALSGRTSLEEVLNVTHTQGESDSEAMAEAVKGMAAQGA